MIAEQKKYLWQLGQIIDVIHIPALIVVLGLGGLVLPPKIWALVDTVIVSSQIILLGCPLVILSSWLRKQYDSSYKVKGSLTLTLYRRYGRWVGLPIFIAIYFTGRLLALVVQS